MKAIRLHPDGGAEALRLRRGLKSFFLKNIKKPIPGPCDVLVRVHAVAVSAAELT